jgi:hypothetical protein
MGFRILIGFIEQLQTVTTSNYSAIATARTESSQSAVSSASVLTFLLSHNSMGLNCLLQGQL